MSGSFDQTVKHCTDIVSSTMFAFNRNLFIFPLHPYQIIQKTLALPVKSSKWNIVDMFDLLRHLFIIYTSAVCLRVTALTVMKLLLLVNVLYKNLRARAHYYIFYIEIKFTFDLR